MTRNILSPTISISVVDPFKNYWNFSEEFLRVSNYAQRALGFFPNNKGLSSQSILGCPHLNNPWL
jgi:hypothetical protein